MPRRSCDVQLYACLRNVSADFGGVVCVCSYEKKAHMGGKCTCRAGSRVLFSIVCDNLHVHRIIAKEAIAILLGKNV